MFFTTLFKILVFSSLHTIRWTHRIRIFIVRHLPMIQFVLYCFIKSHGVRSFLLLKCTESAAASYCLKKWQKSIKLIVLWLFRQIKNNSMHPVSKLRPTPPPPDYPKIDIRVGGNCLWGVKRCKIRWEWVLMGAIFRVSLQKDIRSSGNLRGVKLCKIRGLIGVMG